MTEEAGAVFSHQLENGLLRVVKRSTYGLEERRKVVALLLAFSPIVVVLLTNILDYSLNLGIAAFVASVAVPGALALIVRETIRERMRTEEIDWERGAGRRSNEHIKFWLIANFVVFFIASSFFFYFSLSVPSLTAPALQTGNAFWAFWLGIALLALGGVQGGIVFHFSQWPDYELPLKVWTSLPKLGRLLIYVTAMVLVDVVGLRNFQTLYTAYGFALSGTLIVNPITTSYVFCLVASMAGWAMLIIALSPWTRTVNPRKGLLYAILMLSPIIFSVIANTLTALGIL